MLTTDPVIGAAQAIQRYEQYIREHRREYPLDWYPWQRELFKAGGKYLEVMLLSGNRAGKTCSLGYQDALHITGDYPPNWPGHKITNTPTIWLFGVDATQIRDVLQKEVFGDLKKGADRFSGGWVHPDEVSAITRSQIDGLARDVWVKHKSGRDSRVALRSYRQIMTGQDTLGFAGSSVDYIHCDEQPPDQLMGQLRARIMTGDGGHGGRLVCGCTPELGPTEFIVGFMDAPKPSQKLIGPIGWEEAPHLSEEMKQHMKETLPPHELEMRSKGIPYLAGGRIFDIAESRITCEPFEIPAWYRRCVGVDIGLSHKTAAVWSAYDADSDIIYIYHCYAESGELPAYHAARIRSMGENIPVIFPHDVESREKGSGKTILQYYRAAGITNSRIFENADGSNYIEPGIMDMQERLRTGRMKIFSSIDPEFWQEYRLYRRDKKTGRIIAEGEDIMSAWRYSCQSVARFGKNIADTSKRKKQINYKVAI